MAVSDHLNSYYLDLNLFGKILWFLIILSFINVLVALFAAFTSPETGAVATSLTGSMPVFFGALLLYLLIEGFGHKK